MFFGGIFLNLVIGCAVNIVKFFLRFLYSHSDFSRRAWFLVKFVRRNRYLPNFKHPLTYNEKVNYRKADPRHSLFSLCADKIKVKNYVSENVSPKIVIPNYYTGDNICAEKIKEILAVEKSCVLKTNHDSGGVHVLTEQHGDIEIQAAVDEIAAQLAISFGDRAMEPWYSGIRPQVLVEMRLPIEEGESNLRDYKFHVFRQRDGSQKIILAIDFDRNSNHTRSFFDEDFNWLNLRTHVPSVKTVVTKPARFAEMCCIAKELAAPFSYARIDLYYVNHTIYFGEMTFAPGGGYLDDFQSRSYDRWMGNLWQCDPRY